MEIIKYSEKQDYRQILQRPYSANKKLRKVVKDIIKNIRDNGDKALFELAAKFDNSPAMKSLQVSQEEIEKAAKNVSSEMKHNIQLAATNIEKYHKADLPSGSWVETSSGVKCWSKRVPIEKVGLYIPGGNAPLFSSVLMLGIPAKIAGNDEIVICTPPNKGQINPLILYTAHMIGINKIYKAGGAQAIAALAYGTESIPAVDKIFGPGNQYVTEAKQLLSQELVSIDMPAGPSEVLVICDDTAEPEFIAADLLSQAEHGPDSQVICVTTSKKLSEQVQEAVDEQLQQLPQQNRNYAHKSLEYSKIMIVKDLSNAIDISDAYAPEHLIIMTKNAEEIAGQIKNAGSVFIGKYSPESAGDYASGTNHVLPTGGWAASYSCLSVDDYMKKISFQKLSQKGLKNIGLAIEEMAKAESLYAHQNAVKVRLAKIQQEKEND
ncbi:MAG: histidinol dehydrogenase [Candidatus Marinimicrobia bacterium]|nr:histidinol dehydrogenase [Candidatus Neomarinimicrobiota bacterium]